MTPATTDEWLRQAADLFGTPSFVYFTDAIQTRIAALRGAFEDRFALSFAVKSNPNPHLLAWLNGRIPFLDISSIGEMRLALHAGWDPARLSFTGPGKRDFEVAEALAQGLGELVIESVREAQLANAIAASLGRIQDVLVRIAPQTVPRGFGDQMAGRPSAFGIDAEGIASALPEIQQLRHLRITGIHIFSGTQCLNAAAVVQNYRIHLELIRRVCRDHTLTPSRLVLGSGLGVPYHDGDVAIDLGQVVEAIVPELDALVAEPGFENARLVLELGRYLVAEAGYFLTRVISVKESRGTRIAICDGGMNNHLPASGHFGMVIRRNYAMHKVGGVDPVEKVDLVGPLCTSIDRLASGAALPRLNEGDLVAVHNSGAYGLTASPIHFISHAPPGEFMVIDRELLNVSRTFGETISPIPVLSLAHPSEQAPGRDGAKARPCVPLGKEEAIVAVQSSAQRVLS